MTTRAAPGIPLTDSELAVATLAASGRTYQEMAAQLFISAHTVQSHLRSVYTKTGTRNRVGLANWLQGSGQ
jgi:DNA-binding CsgD family transcriptional regulator